RRIPAFPRSEAEPPEHRVPKQSLGTRIGSATDKSSASGKQWHTRRDRLQRIDPWLSTPTGGKQSPPRC
ncbi:MAG: hypothetical protein ACYTG0_29795, partial [Planctomycetota bacterium]